MRSLRKHPFPVEAHFEKSLVLGFAVPQEEVTNLLPKLLEPDLFQNRWAFFAVAMVRTKALRPQGFPEWAGRDFTLIGYRIFVRYTNLEGRRLRGLYILGSETDRRSMKWLGGLFTSYRYRHVGIDWKSDGESESVDSNEGLQVEVSRFGGNVELPADSPFSDWREARRFAGPMPFTFSCDRENVTIVEGVREEWTPVPLRVTIWKIPFLDRMNFREIHLANAFLVEDVPYRWKRGQVEKWTD